MADPGEDSTGGAPAPIDEAGSVSAPQGGLLTPHEERLKSKDATRSALAWVLVGILALVVVVGCIGWLKHGDDVDRMQTFAILFGPVVTLLGTVLGFYFSSSDG